MEEGFFHLHHRRQYDGQKSYLRYLRCKSRRRKGGGMIGVAYVPMLMDTSLEWGTVACLFEEGSRNEYSVLFQIVSRY